MIENIIFDWKRTLYNPEDTRLLPNAQKVLLSLHELAFKLILIGKGGSDMEDAVDRLKVRPHFTAVHFVPTKSETLFGQYIAKDNPETTLVVGDRAQGEIAIAKSLGAKAIWLCSGKFKDELPLPGLLPDETIYDIGDILNSPIILESK